MFANNSFFDHENAQRMSFGIAGAFALHVLVLLYFVLPVSQKIISAEVFTPPTNVSIRFIDPVQKRIPIKPPQEIARVEPVQKKPLVKKIVKALTSLQEPTPVTLNKIEPAAAPVQTVKIEPIKMPDTIPVFSTASVKGRRIQPQYPKRAIRLGQEGVVWIHVLISSGGVRQDIKVHKPSRYALLNQAALKAAKKWKFEANFINGRAAQGWVAIPIEFKIR